MELRYDDVTVVDEPQLCGNRFKILILGRNGSGKSALIHRLKNNVFPDPDTIASFPNVTVVVRAVHGSIFKADLVESDLTDFLAKDSSSNKSSVHFARQTLDVNGLLLIYDITNSNTFWEIDEVLRIVERMVSPDVDICLVGTKADLVDHRQISFKEAESKSHQLGFSLFETSAMMGINCEEMLLEMLDKLAERRQEVQQYVSESTEVYQTTISTSDQESAEPSIFCWLPRLLWRRKR
ncbi:hypothetical protein KIN20_024290 [Parelaphostrongylus tenuis]|uniref:Uncharacterized protein n=1 Tax=Parelaphostrongylus tenuis TaxID=148309 RepID=A0AAD5QXK9_PARTN|nr:hypothetical protein KIN20_024290 [Parelaphostrongylus tenuis]